jgi:hypothetical protein
MSGSPNLPVQQHGILLTKAKPVVTKAPRFGGLSYQACWGKCSITKPKGTAWNKGELECSYNGTCLLLRHFKIDNQKDIVLSMQSAELEQESERALQAAKDKFSSEF